MTHGAIILPRSVVVSYLTLLTMLARDNLLFLFLMLCDRDVN